MSRYGGKGGTAVDDAAASRPGELDPITCLHKLENPRRTPQGCFTAKKWWESKNAK
jgi:hypothetical protein